jgi:mono/diheme cytochrome c family protein
LAAYLATGHASGHGSAGGPMGEAVDEGLSYLTRDDIAALRTYLRSVPAIIEQGSGAIVAKAASTSHAESANADERGKMLFAGACQGCHNWSGESPVTPLATLTGARAVNDARGTNVAQIVINGARRTTPPDALQMPAFGRGYSDTEIAAVTNFVTGRFGATAARLSGDDVARLRRESASP